jgi:2-hydroxy-6-oxonona-2,4-dienedioate hydrolase
MARMENLRSVWSPVGGLSIHARVSEGGPPGGLPVVLVHGYGVSGSYMVPVARRIAAERPVYVPDLPGHGRSDKPERPLRVPELAEALRGWMDAVGLRRAALLGNSMGCQIAAELAVRDPARVDRLILVGPTADAEARTAGRQVLRLLRTGPFERPSIVLLLGVDYFRAGPKLLVEELKAMLEDRIEDKLPRIKAPALVIRGGRDAIVPRPWADRVARLVGADCVLEIPRAGHAPNYSAPDALMRLIRPFLSAGSQTGFSSPETGARRSGGEG